MHGKRTHTYIYVYTHKEINKGKERAGSAAEQIDRQLAAQLHKICVKFKQKENKKLQNCWNCKVQTYNSNNQSWQYNKAVIKRNVKFEAQLNKP